MCISRIIKGKNNNRLYHCFINLIISRVVSDHSWFPPIHLVNNRKTFPRLSGRGQNKACLPAETHCLSKNKRKSACLSIANHTSL